MKIEAEEFDETKVTLDPYNSDLNLNIDGARFSAKPLVYEGFAFMWAGARATHGASKGKFCFEVKILENLNVDHLPADEPNPHVVRVGFSVESSTLQLGEDPLSYGYGGTGKISTNCQFTNFGQSFGSGDVILGAVNADTDTVQIGFAKNGKFLGWAYKVNKSELKGQALFPHVLTKNVSFEVNLGQKDKPYFPLPDTLKDFSFIGCLPMDKREGGTRAPKRREDCEMIMMCGIPGAGKSYWAAEYCKKNPQKKYNVLGTNNIIDKMKIMGLPRKRNYHGRWEVLIQMATKCLNKMFEIGSKLKRNYILDQTNVYPTAQRRKMRNFEGFQRKAVVVVPSEEEYRKRCDKRDKEEGKEVPDSAVNEMKANFKLPEVGDIFNEVIYTDLQKAEAEKLVAQYNEEGKAASGPPRKQFRSNDGSGSRFDSGRDHQNSPSRGGFSPRGDFERGRGGFRGGFDGGRGGFDRNRGGFDGHRGGFDGHRGGYDGPRGGYDGGRGGFEGGRGGFEGGRGFNGGRGGFDRPRGGFDGGRGFDRPRGGFDGGRGGFDRNRGGRGGFDGGREDFDRNRGERGEFDRNRGGFDGGRGSFDRNRGGFDRGRGGFDRNRGGFDSNNRMDKNRAGFDGDRGNSDRGRGGFGSNRGSFEGSNRGSFEGSNRGSFEGSNRGGFEGSRGTFDSNRGGFDRNRGGRFDNGQNNYEEDFGNGGSRGGFNSNRGGFDGGRGGFDRKRKFDDDRSQGARNSPAGYGEPQSNYGEGNSFRGGSRGGRGDYGGGRQSNQDSYGGRDGHSAGQRGGYRGGPNRGSSNSGSRGGGYGGNNFNQEPSGGYGSSYGGGYGDKSSGGYQSEYPARDTGTYGQGSQRSFKKEPETSSGFNSGDGSRSTRASGRASRWSADTSQTASSYQDTSSSAQDKTSYSSYTTQVKSEPIDAGYGYSSYTAPVKAEPVDNTAAYGYDSYASSAPSYTSYVPPSQPPAQGYQTTQQTYGYQTSVPATNTATPQAWATQQQQPSAVTQAATAPTTVQDQQQQWAQYYQQQSQYYNQYYGQQAAAAATTPAYGAAYGAK